MKSIWTILSVVALANVLALAGLVLWLKQSDRLDADRMREVRQLFSETIAARKARQAAEAEAQLQAQAQRAEQEKFERTPATAEKRMTGEIVAADTAEERLDRSRREIEDLKAGLIRQQDALERSRKELAAERAAFESMREEVKKTEGSAQFKRTIGVLEGLKPDAAFSLLRTILDEQPEQGREQVVAYLNAMQERQRNKVFAEIVQADPVLAADLLERLRTRGTIAGASPPTSPP